MDSEIDREIRRCLDEDDSSALGLIWDAYARDLLGYLMGVLCSRQEAEDTLQDLFVRIAQKRGELAKAEKLKPYLFRMAKNLAVNRISSQHRRRERDRKASEWLYEAGAEEKQEKDGRVQAALETLPSAQRSVIVMKFFRSKNFREIGEMLGISENTASSRYRYGMDKLRTMMRGMGR